MGAGVGRKSLLSMEDSHPFPHLSPARGVSPALGAHRCLDRVSGWILGLCLAGEQHLCATAGPGAQGRVQQLTQDRAGKWQQENREKCALLWGRTAGTRKRLPLFSMSSGVLQRLALASAAPWLCWGSAGITLERGEGFTAPGKFQGSLQPQ